MGKKRGLHCFRQKQVSHFDFFFKKNTRQRRTGDNRIKKGDETMTLLFLWLCRLEHLRVLDPMRRYLVLKVRLEAVIKIGVHCHCQRVK